MWVGPDSEQEVTVGSQMQVTSLYACVQMREEFVTQGFKEYESNPMGREVWVSERIYSGDSGAGGSETLSSHIFILDSIKVFVYLYVMCHK